MISEKTGGAESFSYGLTQQLFEAVRKIRVFARGGAAHISCCLLDARRDIRHSLARCWYGVPSTARSRSRWSRVHDEGIDGPVSVEDQGCPPGNATVRLVVLSVWHDRPHRWCTFPLRGSVVLVRFTGSRFYDTPFQATTLLSTTP